MNKSPNLPREFDAKTQWSGYEKHAILKGGPSQHWTWNDAAQVKPLRTRRKTARKVAVKPVPKKTGSTNPYNFTPQRKLQGAPDTARPVRNITW